MRSPTEEVKQAQKTTHKVSRLETEPPYVKLYLDCLSKFKGMQVSFNPILNEFLKRATYADPDDETGGQVIYCTKIMKEIIAKKCEVSFKRVEQAITEFVKKGIFSRIGVGTYQVNPYLFGRGEWKDIRKIRATFDFNTGEAIADIVKDEEAKMTTATEALEEQYQQKIKRLASQFDEKQMAFADLPTRPATITVTAPDTLSATTI